MMNYVCKSISDFFVSAWLWHMTFDWFHPLITGLVMYCLIRIVMRKRRMSALIISVSAQCFVITLFFFAMIGCIMQGAISASEPLSEYAPINTFFASLAVALVYVVFQSLYFWIISCWFHDLFLRYFFILMISNSIGMIISNVLARMAMAWNYVG